MNQNHCLIFKYLLTGTLFIAICISAKGQQNNSGIHSQDDNNYSIKWVSQYPAVKNKKKTKEKQNNISKILLGKENGEDKIKKNKNWFTDILFGKKSTGLVKPMSVLAINPDTFWIADQGTGSILHVFNQVGEITRFRNKNIKPIPSIVGSCFMPDHKILFTDSKLNRIFQIVPGINELLILNDSIVLEQPTGIAYSAVNRQIWVVETKVHRISVLNEKGELIKRIGERGYAPGQFNFPTYIWIDKSGIVYVVDAMNFRIQLFDTDGEFISEFGEIGDATGYFSRPKGIATDSFGHIYIVDALFHTVQIFDRTGKLLYVFGSKGQEKEQFWMPTGIYIDNSNYIYVADSYNSRVQVFQLTFGN
jgi:DNA-binding beta-propeller fold protein YncE